MTDQPPTPKELKQLQDILGLSTLSVLSKEGCYRLIDEIVRLRALCGEAETWIPNCTRVFDSRDIHDRLIAASKGQSVDEIRAASSEEEQLQTIAAHDAALVGPLVEALEKLPKLRNPKFSDDAGENILERGTRDDAFDLGYDKGDLDCRRKVHQVVAEIRAATAPHKPCQTCNGHRIVLPVAPAGMQADTQAIPCPDCASGGNK